MPNVVLESLLKAINTGWVANCYSVCNQILTSRRANNSPGKDVVKANVKNVWEPYFLLGFFSDLKTGVDQNRSCIIMTGQP